MSLEDTIQKKAEYFYLLGTREQNKANITKALHEIWEETEKFCREQNHKRKQHTLDYCHFQVVTTCDECFNKMLKLHNKYYKELTDRGWNPW